MTNNPTSSTEAPIRPTSSSAILSLIAGILGLTLFPVLGSVVALVTGYAARSEIRGADGAIGGEGLAVAGIVLGWIGVGMLLLGLCGVVFFVGVPLCLSVFFAAAEYGAALPVLLAAL